MDIYMDGMNGVAAAQIRHGNRLYIVSTNSDTEFFVDVVLKI